MPTAREVTTDNWGIAPFNRWSFQHVQELGETYQHLQRTHPISS